jgi:hypothetical protein
MSWYCGKYYYRNVRIGKRVRSEYVGSGETAELIAQLDQHDITLRALERFEKKLALVIFRQHAAPPPALDAYSAAVRGTVADVLGRLGFHRHKRQWRRKRMDQIAVESVARQAADLFFKKKPNASDLKAYRQLLNEHTALARTFGDLSVAADKLLLMIFKDHATMRIGAELRIDQLRVGLGYDEATTLEQLLIDDIVLCWIDYYRMEISYAQNTKETFALTSMEQWEQVLASKQRRYHRAIESLARVRRLLNLPGPQFTFNVADKQVNVNGTR